MRTRRIIPTAKLDERMAELRLTGRYASGGFAAGPVALLSGFAAKSRRSGDPDVEAGALRGAIIAAIGQLSELAAEAQDDGAAILAFQIAMLEDDALAAPVFAAIAVGTSADRAWRTPMTSTFAPAPAICAIFATVCLPPCRA
jgi:phosphoenolpyruvate-protein phosphotransferase (PTS system enzyme I)